MADIIDSHFTFDDMAQKNLFLDIHRMYKIPNQLMNEFAKILSNKNIFY